MKAIASALLLALVSAGAAQAQSTKMLNPAKPEAMAQMQKGPSDGVATDAAQVKQQQGRSAAASPGTVGAAPGGSTTSQTSGR